MGLGMGVPMGGAVSSLATNIQTQPSPGATTSQTADETQASQGGRRSEGYTAAQRIELLRGFAELRAQGILSESEFESEKNKILGS
jgi:hypothetical protein